jgi:hypothetical protein
MNYTIVTDENELKKFIDWLPILNDDEIYYVCLFARSKYAEGISHVKSDKAQLKRFTTTKEWMFDKIKQLECEVGSYKQYTNNVSTPIPQEALALYITVNPRSTKKAMYNSLIHLASCLRDNNINVNPHQEVMSEIQKAKSKTYFVDFDIDEPEYVGEACEKLRNMNIKHHVLKTRGGFHILVEPDSCSKEFKSTWYNEIKVYADVVGDNMIPVPGTYQGGFTPKFDYHS